MQYDHKQNLAFLLSLAALPMAGCIISGGDDDDDGAGTGGTANSADDDGTTGGDDTTGGGSVTLDGTGSDSVGDTGSTGVVDETGAGTTGGETPQVCTDAGAHFEKCMLKDPQGIVTECVDYTTDPEYSAECIAANEEYYACLAMADCKALVGKENPCQTEQDAIFDACAGGGTTGGGEESSTGG